jgi:hypothetical protein
MKGFTYNIKNGRGERSDMSMDFAVLTETKLQDGSHTRYYQGYEIKATNAQSKQQGVISLIWKEVSSHGMESITKHGYNVLRFELVTGSY